VNAVSVVVCAGIVVLGGIAAMIAFVFTRQRTSPSRDPQLPGAAPIAPAPRSNQVVFFLRFEGRDDEDYVKSLLGRHGSLGTATAAREAALDLVRAAPTATHAWVGPASEAPHGPSVAHSGLPGGVVVGFAVSSRQRLDTVGDDADLGAVVQQLRGIAAWTDHQFAGAQLVEAEASLEAQAPPLRAVRKETRPGHQLCPYCDQAYLAHETRCPNCGARATA